MKQILCSLILLTLLQSCNNGPKVIEPNSEDTPENSTLFKTDPNLQVTPVTSNNPFGDELHGVVVKEAIPASRYVYLNVTENGKTKWLATNQMDIKIGGAYYYRGGLLKTNFESRELEKQFDTIYLVSNLVPANHAQTASGAPQMNTTTTSADPVKIETHTETATPHKGIVSVAELVADPAKYEGHTIQVKGKCVKVNPNIMNRNWIHIQDGTKNDYDLVITSADQVVEGQEFSMKAVVHLNRDFGAGYKYDLILENGILVR